MTLAELTSLLAWCSAINISLLMLATLILTVCQNGIIAIHSKLFGLAKDDLLRAYFQYLAQYKLLILVFNLVPYIVLRCAA